MSDEGVDWGSPTRRTDRSLSIVIPAFNEVSGIGRSIDLFSQAAQELVTGPEAPLDRVELVVVDDGSTDRTAEVVAGLAQRNPLVRLVRHETNRGLGAGIRTGIAHARGDLILYTDADLPVSPDAIGPALAEFRASGADLLAGRRSHPGGEGLRRRIYTACYNRLIRLVFGLALSDVNFAFKMFPRSLGVALDLRSEGSFIDAELVARVARTGGCVVVRDFEFLPRQTGESSLATLAVIRGILVEMAHIAPSIRRMTPGPAGGAGLASHADQ